MYDVRQFRPVLYLLMALGITGFAIAAQIPIFWALVMWAMAVNALLISIGRFKAMPRWVSAIITVISALVVLRQIRAGEVTIIAIGEFLVILHLVKMYEQRGNRDFAQMLLLSLLLMAASAISTASLLFGILLVFYLLVSLYCSLLFHLKVEADAAREMLGDRQQRLNPSQLRQDQRRLGVSMRRLTGLVAVISVAMGVVVFLFFPRYTTGTSFLRPWTAASMLTGFDDHVSMDHVTSIGQSEQVVAQVRVTHEGKAWGGMQPLLLRGTTLDDYLGPDPHEPWQWKPELGETREIPRFHAFPNVPCIFTDPIDENQAYGQEVTLQPSGTHVIFAMAGPFMIECGQDLTGAYSNRNGALTSDQLLDQGGMLHYTVWSTNHLVTATTRPSIRSGIDPQITALARRPDVCGSDAQGRSLADLIGTSDAPPNVEHLIAQSMAGYLRTHYTYSRDPNPDNFPAGVDPIVSFLYTARQGHCTYFAGAMTLMCQSLGIPARMVVGYYCDEFNSVGQFYTVRQSHAHAWVEVLTAQGWETVDPTSSTEAMPTDAASLYSRIKSLFNFMEYRWATSVVAYGQENQQNVMTAMDSAVSKAAVDSSQTIQNIPRWVKRYDALLDRISTFAANSTWIATLLGLLLTSMAVLIAYYLYEHFRLSRRAVRIGLGNLPAEQRGRLVRQLGFYDDLLRVLERRGIVAPPHVTPMEFSSHLDFLPHRVCRDIRRLTRLFYRVRFGEAELNAHRRKRLAESITRIEQMLKKGVA